jgi:predicted TPR repeat methyltransferase
LAAELAYAAPMEPTEGNLRAWEEAHRPRGEEGAHGAGVPEHVRRSLASVAGKRVLHIQCGTGEGSLELAELGAVVTGVDPSEEALEHARERGPSIVWVHAEPGALPAELRRGRFDLVFADRGVLAWVADLAAFAAGASAALKPGADLLLFEEHPAALCVDAMMHWRDNYFAEDVRLWRLGQVVTALARVGLVVRALEEYPARTTGLRRQDSRLPGEFLLHAVKPA